MVAIDVVNRSNALIPTALPPGLVAVFAGATSGIGEATLKLFAKLAVKPRAYILGRSQSAAERVIAECRTLNPDGEFIFLQKELDLLKKAREVIDEIKKREEKINILFLSAGGPDLSRTVTSEGLHKLTAIHVYGRLLFTIQLLPLLRAAAPTLARVIFVAAGAHEGPIDPTDFPAIKQPVYTYRGHACSMTSLCMQRLSESAPDVAFVNDYPGLVVTKLVNTFPGAYGVLLRVLVWLFGRWAAVPLEESAARHLFLVTSEAYKPREGGGKGVPLVQGLEVHTGIDGKAGSGVYSIGSDGEGPGKKAVALLEGYRKDGMQDKVWAHVTGELERVEREHS